MCVEPTRRATSLHLDLFWASPCASSGVMLTRARSLARTSDQRVRGAPGGLFHPADWGLKFRIARVGWSGGSRVVSPPKVTGLPCTRPRTPSRNKLLHLDKVTQLLVLVG
ncbi:hypothetical protein Bbelb_192680 [Branchiostoma belcheri]|nr:hypothetical protein Bbelb_192680 [Branchiostoma belcheri]